MSDTNRQDQVAAIQAALADMQPKRRGAIPCPAIINDKAADPALRRAALKSYASAVLETPVQDWSNEMRAAVLAECHNVCVENGL